MDAFLLDLKYSLRSLWRERGFAVTVVLTFAVCIAANTALFAIVHGVILHPLPVPEANSLLIMSTEFPSSRVAGRNNSCAGESSRRVREMACFESKALFRDRNQTVELNGSPQQ